MSYFSRRRSASRARACGLLMTPLRARCSATWGDGTGMGDESGARGTALPSCSALTPRCCSPSWLPVSSPLVRLFCLLHAQTFFLIIFLMYFILFLALNILHAFPPRTWGCKHVANNTTPCTAHINAYKNNAVMSKSALHTRFISFLSLCMRLVSLGCRELL